MNRGTVVLLALAILLAHTLAIHLTPDGRFALPYEIAHVAFRLGRNLVYDGTALWNPGGPPTESYPSPAWIAVCAAAARVYASPIAVTRTFGLVSVLATVVVLAQFSPKRTAGLIAPILLASSGSAAACAFSGTEAGPAMLLVATSFLAFERGWTRTLAVALSLLLLTRPEGGCVLLVLIACERFWRPRGEHEAARRPGWGAYTVPLVVACAATLARRALTGTWLSPFSAPLLDYAPERWNIGAQYLSSFVVSSGFGLLFLVVILSACAGRTSAWGARALALAATWWTVVAISGGDGLPFWNAVVPVLPLFFLGVQECMRTWMDEHAVLARVVWPVLFVTVAAAMLVSKVPGDIGPLPLEQILMDWQRPRGVLARAYPHPLARLGLMEEIRTVDHLRTVGIFLRNRVGADAAILTAWPGAIGYLSRKEVLDMTGRAWPLPQQQRTFSWRGVSRVDVVASLSPDIDYIVPVIGTLSETDAPQDFLYSWLEQFDVEGATEERVGALLSALRDYTLVYVPVAEESQGTSRPSENAFPLLQRSNLDLTPVLSIEAEDGVVRILVRTEGHQQVVDLCVRASHRNGAEYYLRPTGVWSSTGPLDARTSLLLFPTGPRAIQLLEARLPPELGDARISAWLHNPGMPADAPLSQIGQRVRVQL